MRLPNGFGQISKLTGKRLRSPWRAMVTLGKDPESGKYNRKIIGYYESYNKAYEALIEYHKNPLTPDKDIDMKELFKKWGETYFNETRPNAKKIYNYAWRYCESIYDMKVKDVRSYHIKQVVENDKMPVSTHRKVSAMLNLMFDYAVEYEITDKNYSRLASVQIDRTAKKKHFTLSVDEIKTIYAHPEIEIQDAMIIQMYTGLRPKELTILQKENIHLDENYMIGGMKTKAGKDRIIPIHPFIKPLIEKRMKENGEDDRYLFGGMNYDNYSYRFRLAREKLNFDPNHQPHDMRVTFVTLAKKYNVDEYAIKRIVGHQIEDITENTYTDRDPKWLLEEISKIPAAVDLV